MIHVDPRFTRTSAIADLHVPIRAGSDIAFLGGLIRHVLENDRWFEEYVAPTRTRAPIIDEEFAGHRGPRRPVLRLGPRSGAYDTDRWQYEGMEAQSAAGDGETRTPTGEQAHGAHGGGARGRRAAAPTRRSQHPRCVFQILQASLLPLHARGGRARCAACRERASWRWRTRCARTPAASARPRSCYSVGWTQHTVGVQYIRTAAILQLLLGNIGRPGGGIMALRGHASIQGSTDIPTLYNILPGYLPMPMPPETDLAREYVEANAPPTGYWGRADAYVVSLLKAWWGDAATRGQRVLLRLPAAHHRRPLHLPDDAATCATAR